MSIKKLRSKYEKGISVFGHFFSWTFLYRAALTLLNLVLLVVIRYQSVNLETLTAQSIIDTAKINSLSISNAYYQSERNSKSKLMNEIPTPFWKQEYFPSTGKIIMMDYNEAMFVEFLKPLGFPRYYYTLKTDEDVFPPEQAAIFTAEKMELINAWLAQPMDSNGNRPGLFKAYNKVWIDLTGNEKTEGYYRYVNGVDGHIFVYGGTNKPKERKDLKVIETLLQSK